MAKCQRCTKESDILRLVWTGVGFRYFCIPCKDSEDGVKRLLKIPAKAEEIPSLGLDG